MIKYNGPTDEEIINPSEEFLKDIFFNKNQKYWKQGSGDSCIETDWSDERMIFFYDYPYGFFLMRHPDYLVKVDKNINIETIVHLVGGEPMHLPTCSYMSRENAYKVIMNFIKEKSFDDEWIDLYDIEFDHGFD